MNTCVGTTHERLPGNRTRPLVWGPGRALINFLLTTRFYSHVPLATLNYSARVLDLIVRQVLVPFQIFIILPSASSPINTTQPYSIFQLQKNPGETLSNCFVSVVRLSEPLVRSKPLIECEGNLYSFIELLVDSYLVVYCRL